AYQAAIAAVSASEKPLAMRSITVAGRWPARNAFIAAVISVAGRPPRRGTGVATDALAAWQPEQELAPGGASAATATLPIIAETKNATPAQAAISPRPLAIKMPLFPAITLLRSPD